MPIDVAGATLIEVLIAVLVTALIAIVTARTTISASNALQRTSGEVNTNLQIMNFSRNLRFDIAGASDVFGFGPIAPTNFENLCSSWSRTNALDWNTNASDDSFKVRALITIKFNELADKNYDSTNYDPTNLDLENPPNFVENSTGTQFGKPRWYGYELRKGKPIPPSKSSNYAFWKVTCDLNQSTGLPLATPTYQVKLLDIGNISALRTFGVYSGVTALPSGFSDSLQCVPAESIGSSCPQAGGGAISGSTATKVYYSFNLPYYVDPNASLIQSANSSNKHLSAKLYSNYIFSNNLLKVLKRRVEI